MAIKYWKYANMQWFGNKINMAHVGCMVVMGSIAAKVNYEETICPK